MSNEYGAIPLSTANAVGASLKKKMGSLTGFAPVDWAETINKLGNKLPERTVSGAVCSFSDGADDVPMPSVKASITAVQAGSGDPSPSNVRAISGFTTLNFSNVGTVNICDNVFEQGSINVNTGENTTGANYNRTKNYIAIKANQEYYCKSGYGVYAFFYDDSKNYLGYHGSNLQNKTFTPALLTNAASNGKSFALASFVRFRYGNGTFNNDFCVNYPSSDTTLHTTYAGETIPVSFGGQTIYGGELNLTTGVLTVTHEYIASYNGETIGEPWISSIDKYVAGNSPSTGAQVVYPLTTPTTIQLTPEEVRSFLGTNNLWANTGDSEVTYFAQPSGGITPVFTEEVICDNSSASSTLTFTEDWHDYDFLQFKLTNSSSGIITYITTTPDLLDEIFAQSSSKVLFNEYCNNQYITYTESSDPLVWTRKSQRSIDVTEVKGLTATNCTVSTEWIYKRGAVTTGNVTITAPRYFEDYDEIYVATCDGDSDDTMPCILPVKGGTLAACNHYNDYHGIRLTGNVAVDTYEKGETQYIFAMMGINYEEV